MYYVFHLSLYCIVDCMQYVLWSLSINNLGKTHIKKCFFSGRTPWTTTKRKEKLYIIKNDQTLMNHYKIYCPDLGDPTTKKPFFYVCLPLVVILNLCNANANYFLSSPSFMFIGHIMPFIVVYSTKCLSIKLIGHIIVYLHLT